MILDLEDNKAKPFDTEIAEPAMEGNFKLSGLEIGADDQTWEHQSVDVKPAFQLLMEHLKSYTPEWAAKECDVPADQIRKVADEYLSQACIGETIEIEGEKLP
jgi:phenylacetyl-CoA:acceptor oxidoreductase